MGGASVRIVFKSCFRLLCDDQLDQGFSLVAEKNGRVNINGCGGIDSSSSSDG